MSITITNRKGNQTIRATGKDAQALFDVMRRTAEGLPTEKHPQTHQNPSQNVPADSAGTSGATCAPRCL